ncbi:mechanosensitive ion channel family protein [Rubrivivax sp. RP6-9]|uniref:mechanosensitive ion channel family protein n=1 Tax=Rubrivivax sp. RP6-9 TaxID=3415750 RepID=UPI003CC6C173
MGGVATAEDLGRLFASFLQPGALIELAVLAACLGVAWLAVRLLRGPEPQRGSIWFGRGVVDGVLFPVFALLLALVGRWALLALGTVPIAVFKLVVPVLLSLLVIRLTVRVLRAAFPTSQVMRVVERSVSWLAWILMVLWITGVLPLILAELDAIQWKIGSTRISVRNLLEGVVAAIAVMVVALWISAALEQKLLKGATDNISIRKMAANALRALLLFVGLMFALSAAGIDLTALGVLGGALGVGIGFGLQKLAANYISGFVILAERSMRIGDMVRVDNFEGRITDINTRYTVIRALNGRESIVPNEMLITSRVENASLADSRVLLSTVVQVAYGTDVQTLIPRLTDVVAAVPRVLADPGPGVQLSAFAADGLELTVLFWIADPENGQGNIRSTVNLALLQALNDAGIEIPFPQRVLHRAARP